MKAAGSDRRVTVGRVSGVYGVKGWIKVHSYTEPRQNIVGFATWTLDLDGTEKRFDVEDGRQQGKSVIAKLRGVDDRETAGMWIGASIGVGRAALPPCEPGEYYWVDLEGLLVRNTAGDALGVIDHLLATGANDVIVLEGAGQKMIPFVTGEVVLNVDLDGGVVVVDWDASFWDP